ncbi:MAG: hypothetical protein C4530_03595 [Desulfobacteraceae bacterium]|nr:MAG: hypothetical protein C4530_03595 [Desulfobacteraceae bacterium]
MSVAEAHRVAVETIAQIRHEVPFLSKVLIHIDPKDASGEDFHDPLFGAAARDRR